MDTANAVMTAPQFLEILDAILDLGPIGLVLILWHFGQQKTDQTLRQYQENMQEMREMYITNVSLVKKYETMAGELQEVITLTVQTMTKLVERIDREVCK